MVISWRQCKPGIRRRINFEIASGSVIVELIECFDYCSGRQYRVRDAETGHEYVVPADVLKAM